MKNYNGIIKTILYEQITGGLLEENILYNTRKYYFGL